MYWDFSCLRLMRITNQKNESHRHFLSKLRNPENDLAIRIEKIEVTWILHKGPEFMNGAFALPETYLFWIYKFMKLKLL